MARRIRKFSERDYVMFKFVPVGEEFLYNGSKIRKIADAADLPGPASDANEAMDRALAKNPNASTADAIVEMFEYMQDGNASKLKPRTRVAVTRASKLAKRIQSTSSQHDQ